MSHLPAATTETNSSTRCVFSLFRSFCNAALSLRAGPVPQTSALAANAVYRAQGNPRAPQHFANNVAGGSQILLKPEPDAAAGPSLRHPAISGQRGGRPVKMSTGPVVNPSGCSVISGRPGVFMGGRDLKMGILWTQLRQTYIHCTQ